MRVGLIDIDSKIPNLALMKISAYYKKVFKYEVELTSPLFAGNYDMIFASKVFTFSEMPILPEWANCGGSGVRLNSRLPFPEADIMPDYDLYNCKYAIGFTSRGCDRRCPWCIVPEMEGKWHAVSDIYEFWCGQHRIMLLDNSMNTNDGHFETILNQLIKEKLEVDFSQGLDIRYINDKQARLLSRVRRWKRIHFAWDLLGIEKAVRKGIKKLLKYQPGDNITFYVLIGFNSNKDEDIYRVETLRGLGVNSFVMPYDKLDDYQRSFARWVNHKAIFKSVKWEDYIYRIKEAE